MERVHMVLDKDLLRATDRAARKMKVNRSVLLREALREHLRHLEIQSKEDHYREGYALRPHKGVDMSAWEAEGVWHSCTRGA